MASQFVFAQGIVQSPYAQFGYGDIESLASARMSGMGGSGISLLHPYQINLRNPAAAAYNRQYVIFESGFYGQSSKLSSSTSRQNIVSGNIQYLSLLVPMSAKNWTVIAGLAPYSSANTRFFSNTSVSGTNPDSNYVRSRKTINGGLNQVFITNAIKLPKGFALGLTTSYVFGTITRNNESVALRLLEDSSYLHSSTKSVIRSKEIYRFIDFKLGLSYAKKVSSKYSIGLGATATFNKALDATRELTNTINTNNLTQGGTGYAVYTDTVSQEKNSNVRLPVEYGFGFNIDRINKWSFAVDYTYTDFSRYKSFDAVNEFRNANRISFGVEFTPKYNAMRGYINKMVFRAGAFYNETPYVVRGTQITDQAVTFGLGLPIGKGGVGMLNLAGVVGKRGTTSNGLIQENYFRFLISMNINDRWFMRYKVD